MTNNIIVCFLTFIFQSTNCLTFTWPHVASPLPWLKICAFCVLIPPPLLIPPQSAHVSYMSVSQARGVSGEYKSLDYSCLVSASNTTPVNPEPGMGFTRYYLIKRTVEQYKCFFQVCCFYRQTNIICYTLKFDQLAQE